MGTNLTFNMTYETSLVWIEFLLSTKRRRYELNSNWVRNVPHYQVYVAKWLVNCLNFENRFMWSGRVRWYINILFIFFKLWDCLLKSFFGVEFKHAYTCTLLYNGIGLGVSRLVYSKSKVSSTRPIIFGPIVCWIDKIPVWCDYRFTCIRKGFSFFGF